MKKYQGEDIYFSLNFSDSTNPDITSFDDLYNVVVYAYTKSDYIVKYSVLQTGDYLTGYEPLIDTRIDGTQLQGIIKSEHTALMSGQVMLDIMCIRTTTDGDTKENLIQKAMSGIFVLPSLIKAES
jgi:hypothetical protein